VKRDPWQVLWHQIKIFSAIHVASRANGHRSTCTP
jgi:hypothetical protein